MRIEALEAIKSDGYVLDKDVVKSVPDEIGAAWCAAGWARDTAGLVPTGDRKVIETRVKVDTSALMTNTSVPGVK